ncbi:sodium-dependent transporter [Burkholderia sp. Nafp2/4-1b]|uniref:sodium-dependent transporter n=1 Tax=Burkholderia sp. Nafp2/4-1b TaxID=2116686 RepID=UPI000EF85EF1|nr:sodium-dependent transporter [Burkholderia sp. Nafp2/4-1b]RKT98814.1 sodium-dependent transporter [Burkholderia sp. Nafp2/4-1b]
MSTVDRANWGSRLGFVLAAAGSAIGLGAIWKFPYVVGKNGGGAFLLIFLLCVFTIGVALLLAEMLIGRTARKSATTAFRELKGGWWPWAGRLSVLCIFTILTYYSVVGGWTMAFVVRASVGGAFSHDPQILAGEFGRFIASAASVLGFAALFLGTTTAVVMAGIEKGIERTARVLMPALFLLMIVLIFRSVTLPDAWNGVRHFLIPDFAKLSPEMFIEALGLAFFSLSLGGGTIIAYGSYLPKETRLFGIAWSISGLATLACLLAGLMVLPAVFAFNIDPAMGPGLTFITMPAIFARMPFGQGFAILFFVLLFFAALTSSVSILEPVVAFLIDEFGWTRKVSALIAAVAAYVVGMPAALAYGPLAQVTVFGRNAFDLLDYFAVNLLMPAGGLLVALFVGWAIWPRVHHELTDAGSSTIALAFRFVCAIVAPIAIAAIWIHLV